MAVADAGDPVLSPAVDAGAGVIVRKIIPGIAIRAVVLANRAPLPLGKVWSPALPILPSISIGLQSVFFAHSAARVLPLIDADWRVKGRITRRRLVASPTIATGDA